MGRTIRVLIVEDSQADAELLLWNLRQAGFDPISETVETPQSMSAALTTKPWDLIISDYSMPKFNGTIAFELLKKAGLDIPFIFVSGTINEEAAVEAMRCGAKDYMMKGNVKRLIPAIERELKEAAIRRERMKAEQENERMKRLKQYFAPQIAEFIMKTQDRSFLDSHRCEITAVFLDLRGFTAFSDSAEPEEVMNVLRLYYREMGQLIFKYNGTLEHFAGDGCFIFFNDPVPCGDHMEKAVRMALEMRFKATELRTQWLTKGYELHLGIGLTVGYATIGNIGFEGRMEYGAVGNVVNLAARLSAEAQGGQILTNQNTLGKIEQLVEAEPFRETRIKGLSHPVMVSNILRLRNTTVSNSA